eukprot:404818-Prymnesium_polylepis.1
MAMPHSAPAIGTGPRRPAIGVESSTSTLNCSGAAARERPQRCAKLAFCCPQFAPLQILASD